MNINVLFTYIGSELNYSKIIFYLYSFIYIFFLLLLLLISIIYIYYVVYYILYFFKEFECSHQVAR